MNTILSSGIRQNCRVMFRVAGTIVLFIFVLTASAQTDKRLKLADQYYNSGEYYTAAGLYGQFLAPPEKKKNSSDFPLNANRNAEGRLGSYQSRTDIIFKQAESYRLAYYWKEALDLYRQSYNQQPSRFLTALYWQAVALRNLGNFAEAEKIITQFLNQSESPHEFRKSAELEKQTLAYINHQLNRPDAVMYTIKKIHSTKAELKNIFAPWINGNEMYFTSTGTDSVLIGQNPFINRIYTGSLSGNQLNNIKETSITKPEPALNSGAAAVSADGKRMYMTHWKKENGKTVSSIYVYEKAGDAWINARPLSLINENGSNSRQPYCTPDGQFLFFSSDREGGNGGYDIWYARLNQDGTTEQPVNAGNAINSAANEEAPFYHIYSATLVFASDRQPGMGGYDLYTSKGGMQNFSDPENMGHPVNSSKDDMYFFSTSGKHLLDQAYFSSDRGSSCCFSTYSLVKSPKKKIYTGAVYDCRFGDVLAGAQVLLTDQEGNTVKLFTGEDGKYLLEVSDDWSYSLTVSKDQYLDTIMASGIERTSVEAWHTDTLFNFDICLSRKPVIRVENVVTIYFDFDRFDIKPRGMEQLDSIYQVMMEDTTAYLQVSGYTDGKGSVEYNARLSDKRARSCANYLIEKGIDPARITFESFGACCPVEMEMINGRDNPDGRSMNRRALIHINKKE